VIVPMKKAAILAQAKDAETAVMRLRELGVMHVEHQQAPTGKDIASLKDDIATLEKVMAILSSPGFRGGSGIRNAKLLRDWRFAAKHIIDIYARLDHLGEYGRSLASSIAQWAPWGDFDPASLRALADKGLLVRFYEIPASEVENLPAGLVVKKISAIKGTAYCAVLSRSEVNIPFKEILPPKMGLNEMRMRLAENEEIEEALKKTIRQYTCYAERFFQIHTAFARELEFHEALRGMGSSEGITYITGYVPHDAVAKLSEEAKKAEWGVLVTDPSAEDSVPTLVRNPRWVSIIRPVFKLIEIVPGYKELDISPLFLIFLSLFFGMIIGDAGYASIYLVATFFAQRKFGKKVKDHRIFFLFYLFSASAILWGILTGTIFGQEWYLAAGFKPAFALLNNTKFLQAFCFFIGALHLTLAHGWQAIRKFPSLMALADIGWISVIWAAFFLARMLILSDPLPNMCKWLIAGGVIAVIIGASPQRNILKMLGEGVGAVALSIMNNFTDVVSYIRLFAVGLAGVAISDTVNSLSAGFSGSPIAQFFILFFGHAINLFLGPLSVIVHGVRLNVLEFSSHAGLSWSGTAYRPLEK